MSTAFYHLGLLSTLVEDILIRRDIDGLDLMRRAMSVRMARHK